MKKLAPALAPVLASLLLISACSGDEGGSSDGADPTTVLADARTALDETPGLQLELSTDNLPDGIAGVTNAVGLGTHQPAFEGTINVVYSGFEAEVPVTAVDGKVYADIPLLGINNDEIDPSEYGAPDPAQLMSTENGISAWLTEASDVAEGEQVRDGSDILTSYTGTLSGDVVKDVIPSADEAEEFEAVFTIDDEGLLRTASVTGPFYAGSPALTYDVTLTDYGNEDQVTAP